jgi:hypothetical protein
MFSHNGVVPQHALKKCQWVYEHVKKQLKVMNVYCKHEFIIRYSQFKESQDKCEEEPTAAGVLL